jgi:hypothetical protein
MFAPVRNVPPEMTSKAIFDENKREFLFAAW